MRPWCSALWWGVAPALLVALPLLAHQPASTAAALLAFALAVAAAGLASTLAPRAPASSRWVAARREALSLPPPLAVAVPAVPSRPRAPGRC